MQVVSAAPKRENDLLMAGELFLQSGDAQQGIALLSRAESLHPSSRAEVMLAVAYLKLKQPERAQQMLERARSHDPKNPSVFRAVANFYREQHDYKAAIAALKSAPVQNRRGAGRSRLQLRTGWRSAAGGGNLLEGRQSCAAADRVAVERGAGGVAPGRDGSRAIVSCPRRADRSQSLSAARAQGAACPNRTSQRGGDPRIPGGHCQPAQCRRAGRATLSD